MNTQIMKEIELEAGRFASEHQQAIKDVLVSAYENRPLAITQRGEGSIRYQAQWTEHRSSRQVLVYSAVILEEHRFTMPSSMVESDQYAPV